MIRPRTTLQDVLPSAFMNGEYDHTPAMKWKDVAVVAIRHRPWPGIHQNVSIWYELANGKSVGWNENPSRGWSFPCINYSSGEG